MMRHTFILFLLCFIAMSGAVANGEKEFGKKDLISCTTLDAITELVNRTTGQDPEKTSDVVIDINKRELRMVCDDTATQFVQVKLVDLVFDDEYTFEIHEIQTRFMMVPRAYGQPRRRVPSFEHMTRYTFKQVRTRRKVV